MQAGASVKGEFETRLKQVIDEVQRSPQPIVLFIDEAHTLIGAGGAAGTGDAANLLKPALARGTLRTIAATTWAEYKKHIEKDPALTRRFQVVQVDEPERSRPSACCAAWPRCWRRITRSSSWTRRYAAAVRLSRRYIQGAAATRQGGQRARHRLRAGRHEPAWHTRRRSRTRGGGSATARPSSPRWTREARIGISDASARRSCRRRWPSEGRACGTRDPLRARSRTLVDRMLTLRAELRERGGRRRRYRSWKALHAELEGAAG